MLAALAALDVDASGPGALAAALAELEAAPWRRALPPVLVVRQGEPATVDLRGDGPLVLEREDGTRTPLTVDVPVVREREGVPLRQVPLGDLPLGWHRLRAGDAVCTLVVAPARIDLPAGQERTWGWMVQLYALRSAGSWGVGDYADLRTVVALDRASRAAGWCWPTRCTPRARCCRSTPRPTPRRAGASARRCGCGSRTCPSTPPRPGSSATQIAALRPVTDPRAGRARPRLGGQARRARAAVAAAPRRAARGLPCGAGRRAERRSRCGARSPSGTACRGRTGRPGCAALTRRGSRPRARSSPSASTSGAGCSCSSTSSSPRSAGACGGHGAGRRARPGRRVSTPGGADALGAAGRARAQRDRRRAARLLQPAGPGLGAAAVAARPTARDAVRAVPRPGPRRAPARAAGCGSTTSWGCSGCGGCRPGPRPPTAPTCRYDADAHARRAGAGGGARRARWSSARTSAPSRTGCAPRSTRRGVLGSAVLWFETDEPTTRPPTSRPRDWRERGDGHRHHPRPADRGRLPRRGARAGARRARPARHAGRAGARARARASARRCWRCCEPRGCSRPRAATPVLGHARGARAPRPAGWCSRRTATRSATCASPTCRAPSTSTRTGGCRVADGAGRPLALEELLVLHRMWRASPPCWTRASERRAVGSPATSPARPPARIRPALDGRMT